MYKPVVTAIYKRTLTFVLSVLLAIPIGFGFAQDKLSFEHYTVAEGLSQNSVLAITQDPTGYVWFGTRYCLNKYDSRTFRIYRNVKSITDSRRSNEYIHALLTDSKGILWVGTRNGLNRYIPSNDSFTYYKDFNGKGEFTNYINCIYEDRTGKVWVGTNAGPAVITNRGKGIFQSSFIYKGNKLNFKDFKVNAIYEDVHHTLWLGTNRGLIGIKFKSNAIQSLVHFQKGSSGLTDNNITAIAEDHAHKLWVGSLKSGLFTLDIKTNRFTNFNHRSSDPGSIINNNIRKIFVHTSGKLWLATQDGLSIFDPLVKTAISYQNDPQDNHSLNHNSIYDIFQDANGSIWLGTYYGGVNVTHFYKTPFNTHQVNKKLNGISSNVISSLCEDKQANLWIGTEAGGLNYLNQKTGLFITYKNLPEDPWSISSNLIKCVYKDREEGIWIGTHQGGMEFFNARTQKFKHFTHRDGDKSSIISDDVTSLLEDSKGRFWVGTEDQGLSFFNKNTGTFSIISLGFDPKCKYINWIYEDSKQNIWVGASNGTQVLKHGTQKFKHFSELIKEEDRPNSQIINCFREDKGGRIWLGSYFGGLYRFDPTTNSLKVFSIKDGLPSDNILSILEGKDDILWMSTDNGLSRFDTRIRQFINYNTYDGLPGNVFSYNSASKSSNGKFYFGSTNGLVNFFSDSLRKNPATPKVVFTGLSLFNKKVSVNDSTSLLNEDISLTKELAFRYNQNSFSIDFAILNFIKSAKNKFAYKLQGFEEQWNYVETPSAVYTNLNPGSYTLHVKATNNDGVWNEEGAVIKIEVTPPFWMTVWFRILVIAFITIGIYMVYIIRINTIKKQKKVLEGLVEKRTSEVVEKASIIEQQNDELSQVNDLLQEQAQEISRMNILLEKDNQELSVNIEKVTRARVMSKDVDFEEFSKIYPDKETCFKYLSELKWQDTFSCKRCGNDHYLAGQLPYSRRCTKCRYEESVIANTIFQNSRIPINKAFYMLFLVYSSKGKISSHKLSEILSIRQSTCWSYGSKMKKVLEDRKKELKKDADKGWSMLLLDFDDQSKTARMVKED